MRRSACWRMLSAMADRPGTTHVVDIRGDVVVKRFASRLLELLG